MRTISVFQQVSVDGYFTTKDGDSSWTHGGADDDEYNKFVEGNAKGGGALLFGRKTYEMMASFWPTPEAAKQFPVVAKQMNAMPKIVFSKTLERATWANTTLVKDDPATTVRALKREAGPPITIMGSGTIISQLARADLVDEYQLVVIPLVLGAGRSMFAGNDRRANLTLSTSRSFANGKVYLVYTCAKAS